MDPGFEIRGDAGVKLGAGFGNLQLSALVADGLNEQAGDRMAGAEGGAGVASGEGGLVVIECEPALTLSTRTVARVTILGEAGPDLRF